MAHEPTPETELIAWPRAAAAILPEQPSPRTLERWRRLGKAPPTFVIGRKRYTTRSAWFKWLAALETQARGA